jgi:hypothetical protein
MHPAPVRQAPEKYPQVGGRKGLQAPLFVGIMSGILPE